MVEHYFERRKGWVDGWTDTEGGREGKRKEIRKYMLSPRLELLPSVLLSFPVPWTEPELQHGTLDPTLLFHYFLHFTEESGHP